MIFVDTDGRELLVTPSFDPQSGDPSAVRPPSNAAGGEMIVTYPDGTSDSTRFDLGVDVRAGI
jgi:hypothetical protein